MTKRNRTILYIITVIAVLLLAYLLLIRFNTSNRDLTSQPASTSQDSGRWYKNSIIYNLDVKVFQDTDADGIGDLRGLIQRLGYIDSLGVDAIWLAPFQPSPLGDDGYDIMEYNAVDERVGTIEDFKDLIKEADKLGLKIMMDLVVNHTSNQHPWFIESQSSENSPYRDWYIWTQDQPKNQNRGMVFPGVQDEVWTYDSIAGAYYFHRFYRFQPGLNNHHPPVHEEIKNIIKFWMDLGVKGFRLDAVPFMLEKPETEGEYFDHNFELLHDIRQYVTSLDEEAVLLGEANVEPDDTQDFLGEGEGLHMMFNFFVNQRIFHALATGEAVRLKESLELTKEKPDEAEWGQFLRNHDEVDLDRLSNEEQKQVFDEFGPEEHMRLYERGIRRRLAPMLNNNREHLELAYSLLFSLPSAPVLRYGDEIGMGEDLRLQERLAVRTPMQWNTSKNAGFTQNDTAIRPVVDFGEFSYEQVNVQDAKQDPNSLLNWTIEMVDLRKSLPEISYGTWEFVDTGDDNSLGLYYSWEDRELLIIHNLKAKSQLLNISTTPLRGTELENLKETELIEISNQQFSLELSGYGSKWFRVRNP